MKSIKLFLLLILVFLIACLFAWPVIESNDFQCKKEQEFNTPINNIWSYTNEINNIEKRLPKITSVQLLDSTSTIIKFKAKTHSGQWFIMQSILTSDTTRSLHFLETSFGYTATWYYTIRDLGNDQCKLYVTEKSQLKNYWLKLLLLIAGRDIIIQEEIRGIQWMAGENQ